LEAERERTTDEDSSDVQFLEKQIRKLKKKKRGGGRVRGNAARLDPMCKATVIREKRGKIVGPENLNNFNHGREAG